MPAHPLSLLYPKATSARRVSCSKLGTICLPNCKYLNFDSPGKNLINGTKSLNNEFSKRFHLPVGHSKWNCSACLNSSPGLYNRSNLPHHQNNISSNRFCLTDRYTNIRSLPISDRHSTWPANKYTVHDRNIQDACFLHRNIHQAFCLQKGDQPTCYHTKRSSLFYGILFNFWIITQYLSLSFCLILIGPSSISVFPSCCQFITKERFYQLHLFYTNNYDMQIGKIPSVWHSKKGCRVYRLLWHPQASVISRCAVICVALIP